MEVTVSEDRPSGEGLTGRPMDSLALRRVKSQQEAASLRFWWGLT